jgi:acyl carrier protein
MHVKDEIRQIVKDHGRLPVDVDTLAGDADLYEAGMTSHASVNVMLALEDRFGVEFPHAHTERLREHRLDRGFRHRAARPGHGPMTVDSAHSG